jgi:hypothetical protein
MHDFGQQLQPDKPMNITKNRGLLVLAVYLILVGCMGAFGITLGALSILVPIIAIVAGVLLLMGI